MILLLACLAYVADGHGNSPSTNSGVPRPSNSHNEDGLGVKLGRVINTAKKGISELLENQRQASIVRAKVSNHTAATNIGDVLTFPELALMRRSSDDNNKILVTVLFSAFSQSPLINAAWFMYFFGLPSTFVSEEGKIKKLDTLGRKRSMHAIELLNTMEGQAEGRGKKAKAAASQLQIAESALRSSSMQDCLKKLETFVAPPSDRDAAYKNLDAINKRVEKKKANPKKKLVVGKQTGAGAAALLGTNQPALKAGCRYIGTGNVWVMPGPFRRNALGNHLERLVQEDETLLEGKALRSLSHTHLAEACCDRGFVSLKHNDKQMRKCLRSWLRLVKGGQYEPHRVRLAAMAVCSAESMRKRTDTLLPLLYKSEYLQN